jgi:uncharacterized protein
MIANNHTYVLITGAGGCIGRALAKKFAEDGYWLILVDNDAGELIEVENEMRDVNPSISVISIYKDLSRNNAAWELYDEVRGAGHKVGVLVNNASQGDYGLFVDNDWEGELDVIRMNIIAVTELTKLFLKEMIARNEGKILQVASVASFIPAPHMAVYAASKAYLLFLSEALQQELKDTDVTLTILFPGANDWDFFRKATDWQNVVERDPKRENPTEVARKAYVALMQGKKREIVGTRDELETAAHDILPDSWVSTALGKLFDENTTEEDSVRI